MGSQRMATSAFVLLFFVSLLIQPMHPKSTGSCSKLFDNCCQYKDDLYQDGESVHHGLAALHCVKGEWLPLATDLPKLSPQSFYPCNKKDVLECHKIEDTDGIMGHQFRITLPGNRHFVRNGDRGRVKSDREEITTDVYGDDEGGQAIITHSARAMFGTITTHQGEVFTIETCGPECYLWVKKNTSLLSDHGERVFDQNLFVHQVDRSKRQASMFDFDDPPDEGDTTTIVEETVTVWYTKELEAVQPNVLEFVTHVIEETNTGYENSNIPIRLKLHCLKKSPISDYQTGTDTLTAFRASASLAELKSSADMAILLVEELTNVCGAAYTNTHTSGFSLAVVDENCAIGYFSFGHEIGHMHGMKHNKESYAAGYVNPYYSYGHGWLMVPEGETKATHRTVMALTTGSRVNIWSSPVGEYLGMSRGDSVTADARRVHINTRLQMAALGDESLQCETLTTGQSISTATTTTVTTTTATTTFTTRVTTTTAATTTAVKSTTVTKTTTASTETKTSTTIATETETTPSETTKEERKTSVETTKDTLIRVSTSPTKTSLGDTISPENENVNIKEVISESYKGSTTYHERTSLSSTKDTIQSYSDPLCSDVWIYCKFFIDFCSHTFWSLWMKGVCYKTCGHCSDSVCTDNLWYCDYYAWACPWSSWISDRCQATCNKC